MASTRHFCFFQSTVQSAEIQPVPGNDKVSWCLLIFYFFHVTHMLWLQLTAEQLFQTVHTPCCVLVDAKRTALNMNIWYNWTEMKHYFVGSMLFLLVCTYRSNNKITNEILTYDPKNVQGSDDHQNINILPNNK